MLKYFDKIKSIDSQIKKKSTGSPGELAQRLNMICSDLYNLIDLMLMKTQGAPIKYSRCCCTFYYCKSFEYRCLFTTENRSSTNISVQNYWTEEFRLDKNKTAEAEKLGESRQKKIINTTMGYIKTFQQFTNAKPHGNNSSATSGNVDNKGSVHVFTTTQSIVTFPIASTF